MADDNNASINAGNNGATTSKRPDQGAYTVTKSGDGKEYWNSVGAAWKHNDGKGTTIKVHSTPVNGEIVLRDLKEQQMQTYAEQEAKQPAQNTQQIKHDYEQ